jgi:hypothetical protein
MRTNLRSVSDWRRHRDRWPGPPDVQPRVSPPEVPIVPEPVPTPPNEVPLTPRELPVPPPAEVPEPGERDS